MSEEYNKVIFLTWLLNFFKRRQIFLFNNQISQFNQFKYIDIKLARPDFSDKIEYMANK